MEKINLEYLLNNFQILINENLLQTEAFAQLIASALVVICSYLITKRPRKLIEGYINRKWDKSKLDAQNEEALIALIFPVTNLILQWLLVLAFVTVNSTPEILIVIAKLLTAWVIIRFVSSFVKMPTLSKLIATIAWSIAALSIVGKLGTTIELLDSFAIDMGEMHISALSIIKGIITFSILLWVVGIISRLSDRKIKSLKNITPSARVLLTKSIKTTLIAIAILIGIDSLGIDLTALTVFGGAIGLGLGFGLQKVVSNLVCGVILLLDRSVKPGDVIEVDETYGEVNSLGARYVSVITRDGYEHLIPNENLITEKVVNWSYSNKNVRLKIPVSISYDSDLHIALELLNECAESCPRVLKDPIPVSRILKFADSGIDLELRVWINSPSEGVVNVKSEILLAIWDKFKEKNISIPFPQREVSVKPSDELQKMFNDLINQKPAKAASKK